MDNAPVNNAPASHLYGVEPLLSWDGCSKAPIDGIPGPRELARLSLEDHDYVALLEAGGGFKDRARFSFVGIGARALVVHERPYDAFSRLGDLLEGLECRRLPSRNVAFFVVSYESVLEAEPWLAPKMKVHEWPALIAFTPEVLVVYDHAALRAVICPGDYRPPVKGPGGALEARIKGLDYSTPREDYLGWVREVRRLIGEGEAFQVVISRVERYLMEGDLFGAYERLASSSPSPYMFYMKLGDRSIAGSSPELLVKLDGGRLESHPIAGTRPRGSGVEDIRLEEDLLGDSKELAEHVMLVDLARNDLGSIAVPGSVRVSAFMDVEKYSHVQHIVSRVEALAPDDLRFHEALKAVTPAGTVSGAPKPRAMEIIASLEDEARGPYAGAVGLGCSHAGEAAITIRSAWSFDGLVEIRAGAGIVYDSRPESEYMETEYKLRALKRALGVEP